MRVLIIGASGFIGRYLVRRLAEAHGHEVVGTYRSRAPLDGIGSWRQVELTDSASLEQAFGLCRPEVVVHLAAIADVGMAENEPAKATSVNVDATAAIARLSNQWGARLVFVSTEYVFDGRSGFYKEDDAPAPTTHYGWTKWQAEQQVAKLSSRWSVVRTSIVYGWPAPGRRNFVPWLVERLRSGQTYQSSTAVLRTPVYIGHLVDGIARLVEGDYPGIHHVADRDWVSMYVFARAVAQCFSLEQALVVAASPTPTGSLGAQAQGTAGESANSDMLGLDCARTMSLLDLPHPGLTEGLTAMRASAPAA